MKYITIGLLLAILLFLSCNKDEVQIPDCENCSFTCLEANEPDVVSNDCIDNWDCSFSIYPQSKVDLNAYDGLGGGDKKVFQMILSTEGSPQIADDEFTNILVFELAEAQTSLSAEGEKLSDMNIHFRRICFCTETSFKAINEGCIQGEEQSDGTWRLQGHLIVPFSSGATEVKFDARFAIN